MLTANPSWTLSPEITEEELVFQKGLVRCKGIRNKKTPEGGGKPYLRTKVWRFECPYTGKEFNGTENWYNFFSKRTQNAIKKFIADPKNCLSTWTQVVPCFINKWKKQPDGTWGQVREEGLFPANLSGRFWSNEEFERLKTDPEAPHWVNKRFTCWASEYENHFIHPRDLFKTKRMTLTEVRYGSAKHNDFVFKGIYGGEGHLAKKVEAVNKISDWFLKVSYDPHYKFCRDKQWREFEEIHNE